MTVQHQGLLAKGGRRQPEAVAYSKTPQQMQVHTEHEFEREVNFGSRWRVGMALWEGFGICPTKAFEPSAPVPRRSSASPPTWA